MPQFVRRVCVCGWGSDAGRAAVRDAMVEDGRRLAPLAHAGAEVWCVSYGDWLAGLRVELMGRRL